jgi:hypothetical protein
MSFAMYRLAPVQAVFWGHPISQVIQRIQMLGLICKALTITFAVIQGHEAIDYFLSSELFDIHKPQCQFPM